jgi:nucleoside 2-deoxyribosyltransferase
MTIRGVIENTFGGALCFRGFAKIGDLAKISISNNEYQREADENRVKNILKFLSEGKYRYFPELIFGLKFKETNAIQDIVRGKKSNFIDGINFNLYSKDYKEYNAVTPYDSPLLKRISLEFVDESTKHLTRIDGNHRLKAIDIISDFLEEEKVKYSTELNYFVPFCILLQDNSTDSEKYENAYFYLINSKSKPLTSDDNLKAILSSSNFTDDEIIELIGSNGLKAKQLLERVENYTFQGINEIVKTRIRSFAVDCFDICSVNNINVSVEELQATINSIDNLYAENDKLQANSSIEVLISFVYYKIIDKQKGNNIFHHFKSWIVSNHLFNISEIKAASIIEVFTQIHEKKSYQVFVAMPFWSIPEVKEYNILFKEILNEVSAMAKIELELIPIMSYRGKSQRIDKRLLDSINTCDIFIADITGNNENVIFEVGYAEAKDKHMILLKNDKDDKEVPFDMDKLQWLPYGKEVYYNNIKTAVKDNLKEILVKQYGIII